MKHGDDQTFVRDLAEWHARTADIERDAAMRDFHQRVVAVLTRVADSFEREFVDGKSVLPPAPGILGNK